MNINDMFVPPGTDCDTSQKPTVHPHITDWHEEDEKPFKYRMYGKSELAMLYFPHKAKRDASQALLRWIKRNPVIHEVIMEAGWQPNSHYYTPRQVKIIVEFLGQP